MNASAKTTARPTKATAAPVSSQAPAEPPKADLPREELPPPDAGTPPKADLPGYELPPPDAGTPPKADLPGYELPPPDAGAPPKADVPGTELPPPDAPPAARPPKADPPRTPPPGRDPEFQLNHPIAWGGERHGIGARVRMPRWVGAEVSHSVKAVGG